MPPSGSYQEPKFTQKRHELPDNFVGPPDDFWKFPEIHLSSYNHANMPPYLSYNSWVFS